MCVCVRACVCVCRTWSQRTSSSALQVIWRSLTSVWPDCSVSRERDCTATRWPPGNSFMVVITESLCLIHLTLSRQRDSRATLPTLQPERDEEEVILLCYNTHCSEIHTCINVWSDVRARTLPLRTAPEQFGVQCLAHGCLGCAQEVIWYLSSYQPTLHIHRRPSGSVPTDWAAARFHENTTKKTDCNTLADQNKTQDLGGDLTSPWKQLDMSDPVNITAHRSTICHLIWILLFVFLWW